MMLNLLFLFFLPLLASLSLLLLSRLEAKAVKKIGFLFSLLPLAYLFYGGDGWKGSLYDAEWFSALSIHFHLEIDSLSLLFLYLTAIITPMALLATTALQPKSSLFYALILFLEALLFGLFTARDLALFTFFWEATLIPLYFMISLWGGEERARAATKFILYMIAGSTLMVAAILFLYFGNGASTFALDQFALTAASSPHAKLICLIFLLAFAVKTPLFPFHAWLPDAYSQASTGATILLSALLSKAGIYGLFRINFALFPSLMESWSPFLVVIAVIGVLYGAFSAWGQTDFKKLIAYSSFSHVNFILVGAFVWSQIAHQGALLQAFNHGITITGLFLTAGWLSDRIKTTSLLPYEGLSSYMPKLCWITFAFILSSIALPGTNSFVGEIIIFYSLFLSQPWLTALLATSVILSVVYMLKWMQTTYFGKPSSFASHPCDIHFKQILEVTPLLFLVFWIGIYPAFLLREIEPAAKASIEKLEQPK